MSKEFIKNSVIEALRSGERETTSKLRALEIKRAGNPIRLLALFVDDGSLFIPLIFNSEANSHADNRILVTKTNIAATYDLQKVNPDKLFEKVSNQVLGIVYFGQVKGVYCDGQPIDGLKGLHLFYEKLEEEAPKQLTGEELIQRVFSSQRLLSYFETNI